MNEHDLITTYSSSHQNKTNQLIHYVCVPVIFINVLAFIYYYTSLQVTVGLLLLALIFYYRSLRSYMPLMIVLCLFGLGICHLFASHPLFLQVNLGLFVVAWIGQFWGHKIEGKSPSFFENIFFLLVGPAWIMAKLKTKLVGDKR